MGFTIDIWGNIAFVLFLIIGFTSVYFVIKVNTLKKTLLWIFICIFNIFLFIYSIAPLTCATDKDDIKLYIKDCYYSTEKNNKNVEFFMNLNGIKNTLDSEYKDESLYDYYYDYLDIHLSKRNMSALDMIKYLVTNDKNLVYDTEVNTNKVTEKLELKGSVKTNTTEGNNSYLINGYILNEDAEKKIQSLVGNQIINLTIAYNKEDYNNNKYITTYIIVNTDSN